MLPHSALVPLNLIVVSELQPKNTEEPILVTLFGISILVSELQSLNAEEPILVTLSGISILVSESQS